MKGNKIQLLALLTILLIFPLLSWYYLKSGFDYQMGARAELKDYGKLPTFNFVDTNGKQFSNDSLGNKIAVISFLGEKENTNQEMLSIMKKLNTQFGDNSSLKLLIAPLDPAVNDSQKMKEIFKKNGFDANQHFLLSGEKSTIQNWVGKGIKIPTEWIPKEEDAPDIRLEKNKSEVKDYPFFVVSDKNQTIRNFYPVDKIEAVQRMVEHIALLLPRDVEPDALYVPEKEK